MAKEQQTAEALKGAIVQEASESAVKAFGDRLRAIILTGSVAREEATVAEAGGRTELLGDAEFLLVFRDETGLPAPLAVQRLALEVEKRLVQRSILAAMDLKAIHSEYLRRLSPRIFAYELRVCGQAVWGDSTILSLIPAFSAAEIPLEDAWRLLSNRMIEHLEASAGLDNRPDALPRDVQYRTVKLYRDMATSFLVFVGAYEPTYRGRVAQLQRLAADSSMPCEAPFALPEFADRVTRCTRFIAPGSSSRDLWSADESSPGFWCKAVADAHALWRWELVRLTGGAPHLDDSQLLKKWMRLQSARDRVRGWAYVLRKRRWLRSRRQWPRWLRLGMRASPRYCVYAAASRMFFQLPAAVGLVDQPAAGEADWRGVYSWLPSDQGKHAGMDFRQAIAGISRNYHEFLTGTRA